MKRKPGNLIKAGVSLSVLIVVVASVGAENLLNALRGIDLRWFALAVAIHLVGLGIRAFRWWLLIASLGTPVKFGRLVYLYLVGNFFNTFLPTGFGGDVVKIIELAPARGGAQAFSTVFADRLTGILGSSLIALTVALIDPADVPPEVRALVIGLTAGVLIVTLALTQSRRFDRLIWANRFLVNLPFQGRLHKVYAALTAYSLGALARSTLVSLPFTAALIATQFVLSIALGLRVDVRYFVLFTPIVAMTLVLPALNGLGVREGTFQALFTSVGVAGADAVAMSLLYQVTRVLTGLLGGVVYIAGNLLDRPAGPAARTSMTRLSDSLKIRLLRPKVVPRHAGVYIISYPKSGRTWLRVLLGKALCLQYGLPDALMLETDKLTAAAGLPRTVFTHDYSEILTGLPYDALPADRRDYAGKKVIFIVRDVKDVLVSSYFQATKRTNKFSGPISEFIRSKTFGVRKVVTFYNVWHKNQDVPAGFLLVRYEEMHAAPEAVLTRALRFIGVETVDDRIVREAVAFAHFNNMKKMEAGGYFKDPKMRPGDPNDAESFKVRQGKIGGYEAYLSQTDIDYVDRTTAEMGCPWVAGELSPLPDAPAEVQADLRPASLTEAG